MSAPEKKEPKGSILIVEDETAFLEILSSKLQEDGFKVLGCDKVSQAVRLLGNQEFNCIVMDMQLKQGTGEQLIAMLKRDPHHMNHKTPILVISGNLNPEVLKRVGKEISGAMIKPFERDQFAAKVKSLCAA